MITEEYMKNENQETVSTHVRNTVAEKKIKKNTHMFLHHIGSNL